MNADASIYGMIRPPAPMQDPVQQYGAMMQLRAMGDQSALSELQRTKLTQDLAEEQAFKSKIANWASGGATGAVTPDVWAASPARAAAFEKSRIDAEKAQAELHKTKIETHGAQVKQLRDDLAAVGDQASLDRLRENTMKLYGPNAAASIPKVYDATFDQFRGPQLASADKLYDRLQPKFEKVDTGGKIEMVDVNPVTNPAIRTMSFKKVIGPDAALHAQVTAATQDPFGNLGIRDIVNRAIAPNGGGQAPAAAPAGPTAGLADLHGDDFLKTLPRQQADQIKALADGRLQFPTGQALRTPYWQNMVSQVAQFDPSFDAINYNARSATRKAFTSGAESKSINALNTVMGHLDELDKSAKDLNNSGFTLWNEYVSNPIAGTFSPEFKGRLNKFNLTKQAVVDEMEKAYRGSSGAQGGIEAWKKTLSSADSYQALRASIQQGVKLLNSKMEALGDQYSKGMGTTKSGLELLNDHARTTFNRLVRDADAGGAAEPGKTAGGGIKFLGWEK